MTKGPLIVFDVNETLLDIVILEPPFTDIFGSPERMREWFVQVILYSGALSLAKPYVPFDTLGGGLLQMLGQIHGVAMTDGHVRAPGALIADMPVHPDVGAGLAVLQDTWMVATHTWDTIGAQSFGWKAALVTRGINAALLVDGVPRPTLIARDVQEAARAIVVTC